jgi:hypothetical protein
MSRKMGRRREEGWSSEGGESATCCTGWTGCTGFSSSCCGEGGRERWSREVHDVDHRRISGGVEEARREGESGGVKEGEENAEESAEEGSLDPSSLGRVWTNLQRVP